MEPPRPQFWLFPREMLLVSCIVVAVGFPFMILTMWPLRESPRIDDRASWHMRINLNSASPEELVLLPGIGPTRARRIVEFRHVRGPFRRTQDVGLVQGIPEGVAQGIRDLVTVEPLKK